MKVYSIGREAGCDIVINDNTDVISRRHAVLNVTSSGKMTIMDISHNGTYVNGIRISPNVPVPVTRKDNISFAHVARLDWNRVPKPVSPMRYAIYGLIAILVVIGAVFGYKSISNDKHEPQKTEQAPVDSTLLKKEKEKQQDLKDEEEKKKQEEAKTKADSKKANDKQKAKKSDKKSAPDKAPKKCDKCGKEIKDCEFKGKHPEEKTAKRGDR